MTHRLIALGLAISSAAFPTQAGHIVITLPAPSIYIAVGSLGATIDTVNFPLGAQPLGTPVPQSGAPILIEVVYNRGGGFARPFFMTVTMTPSPATGLTDGTFSVPWTHFSWTSSNPGQLPSGTFTGAPNQQLVNFFVFNIGQREASFTYSYGNTVAFPGGTYTGRVTFTATTP